MSGETERKKSIKNIIDLIMTMQSLRYGIIKKVTLFAQVGFKEFCLKPDSSINFDYCKK